MKETFKGIGVSGGIGRGILVEWIGENSTCLKGSVILLPELDARVALLDKASAIIALSGGITSHGAVLARELEVPCVVLNMSQDVQNSIRRKEVEVDGWEGEVKVLKS